MMAGLRPASIDALLGRVHRSDRIVVVAIIVTTFVRAVVIGRSFFWQDDYIHIWSAWNRNATDMILQEWNGHREPLSFATFWILSRVWPQQWVPAAVLLILLAILLPIAFWVTVRRLGGGPTTATVAATVGFCLWPGLLIVQTWLSAGLEAFTLLILLSALAVYAFDGRYRVLTILALVVLASGFNERSLFIPVVLFLVAYLFAAGSPGARCRTVYRSDRGLWWGLAAVAGALFALSRIFASGWTGGRPAGIVDTARGLWYSGLLGVMKDLAGINFLWPAERTTMPASTPAWCFLLVLLVSICVLVIALMVSPGQLGHCALVVGLMWLLESAAVDQYRGGFIGPAVHQDPRYYMLTATVVLLGVASFAQRGDSQRVAVRWLLAPVAAFVVVGSLVSAYAIARTTEGSRPKSWLATARGAFVGPDAPPMVPTPSPSFMISPFFIGTTESGERFELATTKTLLAVGEKQPRLMTSTLLPVGASELGEVKGVTVFPVRSTTVPGFGADCSVKVGRRWVHIPMSEGGLGNPLLSVDYLSEREATIEVRRGSWFQSARLAGGLKSIWFIPPLGVFSGFDMRVTTGPESICIGAARAGGAITVAGAGAP